MKANLDNLNYEAAVEKLEQIIGDLQKDSLPIDNMIALTAEAKELINFCRLKLRRTEDELNQILEEE